MQLRLQPRLCPGAAVCDTRQQDDGHQSNLDIAAPLLQARGMSACFFITSDFIDRRPGFMSSEQLNRLGRIPGMCIGSHGVSHRFFDDLSEEDSRAELVDSRAKLESITGQRCQSISFPGGRYDEQTLHLLRAAGYLQWYGSEIGTVEANESMDAKAVPEEVADEFILRPQLQRAPIDRVAVRRTTSLEEFARMIEPDEDYFRHHRRRSQVKFLMRRFLGNRLYHGLYKTLSAR